MTFKRSHAVVSRKSGYSSKRAQSARLGFAGSSFPPTLWTIFNYDVHTNLDTTATSVVELRANSLYDPEVAAGGGQPRYLDTLLGADGTTAPYYNYRVHSFKLETTICNTQQWPIAVSVTVNRSTVGYPSSLQEAKERGDTVVRYFGPQNSQPIGKITLQGKIKNYLGVKDLMDVPASASAYNNNPSEQVYATIRLWAMDRVSNVSAVSDTRVTYFSQLYTLNDVLDS